MKLWTILVEMGVPEAIGSDVPNLMKIVSNLINDVPNFVNDVPNSEVGNDLQSLSKVVQRNK